MILALKIFDVRGAYLVILFSFVLEDHVQTPLNDERNSQMKRHFK